MTENHDVLGHTFYQIPDAQYTYRLSMRGITRIPKKIFAYIYQISFGLITSLAFAFIVPTIIDVVVQSAGKQMVAIKAFIVLGASSLFVFSGLIIYLARVISYNKRMNEIPSRVIYVPAQHDLPRPVYALIEKNLKRCWGDIRQQALPLLNVHASINYPGRAPSSVVQQHNTNVGDGLSGTLFPPNLYYEDIILSVGDRLLLQRQDDLEWGRPSPVYTFRQFLRHLHQMLITLAPPMALLVNSRAFDEMPDYDRLANLYDQMRYSGRLIEERTLLEFMVEFDVVARQSHEWLDWIDAALIESSPSNPSNPPIPLPHFSVDPAERDFLDRSTLLALVALNDDHWYRRPSIRSVGLQPQGICSLLSLAVSFSQPRQHPEKHQNIPLNLLPSSERFPRPSPQNSFKSSVLIPTRPRRLSRNTFRSSRSGRSSVRSRLAIGTDSHSTKSLSNLHRRESGASSNSEDEDSMESVRRYDP